MINGLEIIQKYSTEVLDHYGHNLLISEGICEIKIHLGAIMDRKNMSFKKLVGRINSVFLLEFLCAFLGAEGLWDESLCRKKGTCNIKEILKKMNYYF